MRFYYLDFSRAVLFSLGIVLHAAWLGRDRSEILEAVFRFIHSFRMESFFLIAGFFSAMTLTKYSPDEFLRRRLQRLAIPFLFCGLSFNTLLSFGGQEHRDGILFLLRSAYWLKGEWLGHLWFLGTLIVYILVLFSARTLCPQLDRVVQSRNPGLLCFLGLVTAGSFVSARIGHHIPSGPWDGVWFVAKSSDLFAYSTFFAAGYFLFHHRSLLDDLTNQKFANLAGVALFSLLALATSKSGLGEYGLGLCKGAYVLNMCGLLFWAARRYFDADNAIVRSLSDASYTIYLVHWPMMVVLNHVVDGKNLPAGLQFVALTVLTGAFSYAFHVHLVEKSHLLSFLVNGRQNASRKWRAEWNPKSVLGIGTGEPTSR